VLEATIHPSPGLPSLQGVKWDWPNLLEAVQKTRTWWWRGLMWQGFSELISVWFFTRSAHRAAACQGCGTQIHPRRIHHPKSCSRSATSAGRQGALLLSLISTFLPEGKWFI